MPLITPEELPIWVPGQLTVDSALQNWKDVRVRGYHYQSLDVPIPAMRDYMIVVYRDGHTPMNRRMSGPWRNEQVGPGTVSLLTHSTDSHWHWSVPIEVQHLYISPSKVAEIASDAYDRDIKQVELQDILRTDDATLINAMSTLIHEIDSGGLGGSLFVEAVTNQVCVHLLRNYAGELREAPQAKRGLSSTQARRVREFIEEHLDDNLSLADIAKVASISVFHLIRQFNETFGCPPYVYITHQRLDRARSLIEAGETPLKCIAATCGFSDQSHMTRLFRREFKMTPGEYRKNAGR
jgi:AraC family transcriptional regulator